MDVDGKGERKTDQTESFFFFFLPQPQHVEVPKPGIKPEPQQ